MTEKKHNWLLYALITMVTWGIWGAFSDQTSLPKNLVYVVWALSMVPCAIAALVNIKFKLAALLADFFNAFKRFLY